MEKLLFNISDLEHPYHTFEHIFAIKLKVKLLSKFFICFDSRGLCQNNNIFWTNIKTIFVASKIHHAKGLNLKVRTNLEYYLQIL